MSTNELVIAFMLLVLALVSMAAWSYLQLQGKQLLIVQIEDQQLLIEDQRLLIESLRKKSSSCGCSDISSDGKSSNASTVIKPINASKIKDAEFKAFISRRGVTFILQEEISFPKLNSKNPEHQKYW